jgi:gamma-glutamylcyclotransferase (GGCT)/AIG2-like uncharacterized protein YtfP
MSETVSELLFVYGSLMPDAGGAFGLAERTRLAAETVVIGSADVAARLYDLGDYPGLTLTTDGSRVWGTLLEVVDPALTFAWLDPFEDIVAGRDPEQSQYERSLQMVMCDGREMAAWVYVLRRVPTDAKRVASGHWHAPSP